ncbi:hypothetical protein H4R34_004487 [Dimargaris verticillata]|uniref:UBX domain-containing protein 2 n=1 Tax=Dimargaris verticillata TaxID=2761393 RepID=A0A9W8AYQ7_9FUNG|nr:hypothetical protein H4R34_004487 [Dimargaris verticillata]
MPSWHSTDIASVVRLTHRPNTLLLVYLTDDSAATHALDAVFESVEVAQTLDNRFVCLRLAAGTSEATAFNQIYKANQLPTVYIIRRGILQHYCEGNVSQSDLLHLLTKAKDSLANQPSSQTVPAAAPPVPPEPMSPPAPAAVADRTSSRPLPGQVLSTPHRQRKRQNVEEQLYPKQSLSNASVPHLPSSSPASPNDNAPPTSSPIPAAAKVVFRLLDGTTLRTQFEPQQTLADVQQYLNTHRTDGDGPYVLLQTFPHREFQDHDFSATLQMLDLCPSSTLILKPAPVASATPVTSALALPGALANKLYDMLALLYAWSVALWLTWFGRPTPPPEADTSTLDGARGTHTSTSPRHPQSTAATALTRNRPSKPSQGTKRRKPFYTIHDTHESDSDNDLSYNGNSTNMH